ncbi:helix-turn-helix domain-containing protein [Gemmatimonadota bacterium]
MKEIAQLPRLATAREVSEATGLPLSRVYELGRTGQLPAIRLGRAMRFDLETVAEWLRRGGTASPAGP